MVPKVKSHTSLSEETRVYFCFRPQNTDAPTNRLNVGPTIARVSQGLYSLTFPTGCGRFIGFGALNLRLASATARTVQGGTWTAATRVLQVRLVDGSGNVQDLTANADNEISGFALFTQSNLDAD